MLKPVDHAEPPDEERPVGGLVHQLVEEGKAYARAEIGLAKAIAAAKGKALALPAPRFGAALIVQPVAIAAWAVGVVLSREKFLGPRVAGIGVFVIFAGISVG